MMLNAIATRKVEEMKVDSLYGGMVGIVHQFPLFQQPWQICMMMVVQAKLKTAPLMCVVCQRNPLRPPLPAEGRPFCRDRPPIQGPPGILGLPRLFWGGGWRW